VRLKNIGATLFSNQLLNKISLDHLDNSNSYIKLSLNPLKSTTDLVTNKLIELMSEKMMIFHDF